MIQFTVAATEQNDSAISVCPSNRYQQLDVTVVGLMPAFNHLARARGVPWRKVIVSHASPNAAIPTLTIGRKPHRRCAALDTGLGLLAAHFGRWVEQIVLALVDFQASMPFLILAPLMARMIVEDITSAGDCADLAPTTGRSASWQRHVAMRHVRAD